jgi:hypothetical protein
MTRTPAVIIAFAFALSGCSGPGQAGWLGAATAPYSANVGGTGTAGDAMGNASGSTSSSMEEQRIKQQHGGTAPTVYENQTHLPS